jgi:esterase/lipase superfamily enzyme/acyl carrier protein
MIRATRRVGIVLWAVLAAVPSGVALAAAAGTQDAAVAAPSAFEDVLIQVRRQVAERFGVPVEQVQGGTDLIDDLYADPMTAYEVLAIVCEDFGVPVPKRDDLTTVRAIAEYVAAAKAMPVAAGGPKARGAASARVPDRKEVYVQRIFYATDRRQTTELDPNSFFGGERAFGDTVTYGTCDVSIPLAVHTLGKVERPSLARLEFEEDPKKHVVLRTIETMPWEDFLAELRAGLVKDPASGTRYDAFVFIHGFNVKFAEAARRTGQMAYDLGFDGAPILYSWPSDGSLLHYLSDREDAEWSVPHLERFLRDLAENAGHRRLHVLAHSMGNQVLIRALNELALRRGENAEPLFENVILAAPDFDAQVFSEQIAPRIVSLGRRWTLYASDKDKALDASTMLAVKRLGLPLSVAAGVDTVDASGVDVTPWSVPEFHSYFVRKQRVINDLIAVLRGLGPGERDLLRRVRGPYTYWALAPVQD